MNSDNGKPLPQRHANPFAERDEYAENAGHKRDYRPSLTSKQKRFGALGKALQDLLQRR